MSATNKTANYGLSQWVGTDPFELNDFNTDNEKIENAINAALAAAAEPTYVAGMYTGDGTKDRVIELGFMPSAVLVMTYDGGARYVSGNYHYSFGGLAVSGFNLSTSSSTGITSWLNTYSLLGVVNNGFKVNQLDVYSTTNYNGRYHYYIAFK